MMEFADNHELEESSDIVDESRNGSCEKKPNEEDRGNFVSKMPNFLKASEIYMLRNNISEKKSSDEDFALHKGPKLDYPEGISELEEVVENVLDSNKKFINVERIAKNRDCLKAEWNEELNVAIVPHLKGKSAQHMGVNMRGKCALSPEEALYLLEKGCIEVEHKKAPLSVEEAYSVMLKKELSQEKYLTYSYLSQQGFIVVRHQPRIGPRYEKIMNLSKTKQRKRKADESVDLPEQKRLTFTGVLASTDAEENALSNDVLINDELLNGSQSVTNDSLNNDQNMIDVTQEIENVEVSNDDTISSNFADQIESNVMEEEAVKEMDLSSLKDKSSDGGILVVDDTHSKNDESLIVNDKSAIDKLHEDFQESIEMTAKDNNDNNEIDIENVNEVEIDVETNDNKINENDTKDNEIDIETANDDTDEVIIEDEEKEYNSSEINVEDSYSADCYAECDTSDEDNPVEYDENNGGSLDVYTFSPGGTSNNFHEMAKEQDDEVTLVKVMKKENTPLAVIDLLSDDEDASFEDQGRADSSTQGKRNGEVCDDSDDDIQVLDIVPGASKNTQATSTSMTSVKLESRKLKSESATIKTQFRSTMRIPDLFRKDLVCLPRPGSNLLPFQVQPAKEAYVLNIVKSSQPRQGRLWNSYKDMQDYQRGRRLERHMNSFNARRSDSFRDQNDSFPNRGSPFNTPDYSGNRNPNVMLPNRNLYDPMNHERNSLLPAPGGFNSPNSMPFSMNIHTLQNLSSSNPAAFVNELQKTIHSFTSNIMSTIFNQHLPPGPRFPEPGMMDFSPRPFGNSFPMSHGTQSPNMLDSSEWNNNFHHHPGWFPPDAPFSGERHPFPNRPFAPENNWRQHNNFRQRNFTHKGPRFPCKFRNFRRKRNWNDVKTAVDSKDKTDSGSDIEEIPVNLNEFLHSNDIKPLVKPGSKLPIGDVLKALRLTQMANLCDTKVSCEKCLPATPTLEISFDVYLPNTNYKKSEPTVPKYRIIVVRSSDPIPRYSELVYFQRKFSDSASLQIAVVDDGDISFYSFNSINIPDMVPFET